MKKFICLLLALAMVLSLAACGGDTPASTNAPQSTQATQAPETTKAPETAASTEADKATKYTNKVTTTTDDGDGEKGVITIKGITSTKDTEATQYKITETKAPDGYNKMTAPFYLEAKKSDEGIHTTTKTKIYKDAKGNITSTETQTFVEFVTDVDSYNKANSVDPEETSVPVYQFKNIVNEQGTELPSTGGIGTTIFYVVGAILVIGAGVILITRRRMDA